MSMPLSEILSPCSPELLRYSETLHSNYDLIKPMRQHRKCAQAMDPAATEEEIRRYLNLLCETAGTTLEQVERAEAVMTLVFDLAGYVRYRHKLAAEQSPSPLPERFMHEAEAVDDRLAELLLSNVVAEADDLVLDTITESDAQEQFCGDHPVEASFTTGTSADKRYSSAGINTKKAVTGRMASSGLAYHPYRRASKASKLRRSRNSGLHQEPSRQTRPIPTGANDPVGTEQEQDWSFCENLDHRVLKWLRAVEDVEVSSRAFS